MRLPLLIGLSRAMDMILTGRPVDAREALSFGNCQWCVVFVVNTQSALWYIPRLTHLMARSSKSGFQRESSIVRYLLPILRQAELNEESIRDRKGVVRTE